MADEPQVIRGIDWRSTFPFTHIFRTFRIAIHPSKLLLGLLLILLLYAGGRVLDAIWPAKHLAVSGEVTLWQNAAKTSTPAASFSAARREARERIERDYADLLYGWEGAPTKNMTEARDAAREGKYLAQIKARALDRRARDVEAANKLWADVGSKKSGAERESYERSRNQSIASAYDNAREVWEMAQRIEGRGIFLTFFEYETAQINGVVSGVVGGNWLASGGVVDSITNFLVGGPAWLLGAHPLYFVIWGLWLLIVWAILGGAIARIAALQVARDEKLSLGQSLKFSLTKTLSFVFAPLIPLLIILVIGLVIALVALLGNIPWIGPILIGAPFVLALAAGFVMTLVLVGLAGGFTLMYPTIAVEGSDSFDAISRSFSYIYARPWRMLFYTAVALAYGALCYLFVRIFVYLLLTMTHGFVALGMFADVAPGISLWPSLWPAPDFARLPYEIPFLSLNAGGDIGAWFTALWVYLLLGLMGAFVISFYFSANTIIYYLMRREVDATEMEDVYRDESDEEFNETAPIAAAPTPTASAPDSTPGATTVSPEPAPSAPPAPEAPATPIEPPAPTDQAGGEQPPSNP